MGCKNSKYLAQELQGVPPVVAVSDGRQKEEADCIDRFENQPRPEIAQRSDVPDGVGCQPFESNDLGEEDLRMTKKQHDKITQTEPTWDVDELVFQQTKSYFKQTRYSWNDDVLQQEVERSCSAITYTSNLSIQLGAPKRVANQLSSSFDFLNGRSREDSRIDKTPSDILLHPKRKTHSLPLMLMTSKTHSLISLDSIETNLREGSQNTEVPDSPLTRSMIMMTSKTHSLLSLDNIETNLREGSQNTEMPDSPKTSSLLMLAHRFEYMNSSGVDPRMYENQGQTCVDPKRKCYSLPPVPKSNQCLDNSKRNFQEDVQSQMSLDGPSSRRHCSFIIEMDSQLTLSVEIDEKGKNIELVPGKNYTTFNGKIAVRFPPCAVLCKETVFLTVIPEQFVQVYNRQCASEKHGQILVTPVLHIDRKVDGPFLRDVQITLPKLSEASIEFDTSTGEVSYNNGNFQYSQSKFSETGVCYDEVEKVLKVFRKHSHFSQQFIEWGVYFLSEQISEHMFTFDLRKFRNEEEYRLYRMEEARFFVLIVNPERVAAGDKDTPVRACVRGPATINNVRRCRNVCGNKVYFTFPDINSTVADHSNERTFEIISHVPLDKIQIGFEFKSVNLRLKSIDGTVDIPFLSREDLEEISRIPYAPGPRMLIMFIECLGEKWTEFFKNYLKVNMRGLREFIHKDIKASLPTSQLNWSNEIRERLDDSMRAKHCFSASIAAADEIVDELLQNYQSPEELMVAKGKIIECLEESKVLSQKHTIRRGLLRKSSEILARALMYLPVRKLKSAMYEASMDQLYYVYKHREVELFVHNSTFPTGENMQQADE